VAFCLFFSKTFFFHFCFPTPCFARGLLCRVPRTPLGVGGGGGGVGWGGGGGGSGRGVGGGGAVLGGGGGGGGGWPPPPPPGNTPPPLYSCLWAPFPGTKSGRLWVTFSMSLFFYGGLFIAEGSPVSFGGPTLGEPDFFFPAFSPARGPFYGQPSAR